MLIPHFGPPWPMPSIVKPLWWFRHWRSRINRTVLGGHTPSIGLNRSQTATKDYLLVLLPLVICCYLEPRWLGTCPQRPSARCPPISQGKTFWVRRRTNVQQLTCKIDSSNSFYYFFFSFVLIELKPIVLKGKF